MSIKTRYLQLSDTVILEYSMLTEKGEAESTGFVMTELMNGHYAIFSQASAEVEEDADSQKYVMKNRDKIESLNNINHLAVPQDSNDSYWFTFLDNDYEYVRDGNYDVVRSDDIKVRNIEESISIGYSTPPGGYGKYCRNPFNKNEAFLNVSVASVSDAPGWDKVKLYFVSGYDFSDIYGALLRISVPRCDGKMLDLCNFFYTKSNVYRYIKYLPKPIIFGNYIYDKYIEIAVPSIAGVAEKGVLSSPVTDLENPNLKYENIGDLLNINMTANIRLMFSYIDDENKELADIILNNDEIFRGNNYPLNKNVLCQFARTHTIKGSIPTQFIQSDNLGVYIAVNPDYPYIEFYGTWKDMPLDCATVQSFNNSIQLYDNSLIKRDTTYQVDKDYQVEYNMKKWVVLHEIDCQFVNTDNKVVKEETYSLSQTFVSSDREITKFYYRPIYFDELEQTDLNSLSIVLHYDMRLMNIEDSVQFVKSGSLTLDNGDSNINRFWGKGAKLPFADTLSYKVYNKIVEPKHSVTNKANPSGGLTKYVKVFYNVSEISLSVSQGDVANGNYTLIISRAPRNYKFIFKQRDINGNNKYVDLTDSYYKLYAKDANGNDIIIDPTYSSNMNLMLGELEFNISNIDITKLYNVPPTDRYISIVAYNNDNSVSSLYDMRYTF